MGEDQKGVIEQLLEASPDALVVVDEDGLIERASAAVASLFGFAPEELVGQPVETLIPARYRTNHLSHLRAYRSAPAARPMGVGVDLRATKKDGTEFPVDVSLVPVRSAGHLTVGAFIRDATLRRRDDDLLRSINEISRIALEGWDVDGVLGLAARRARSLVGATIAWIAIRQDDRIVVAAADGQDATEVQGATIPAETSLAERVMREGQSLQVPDMTADSHVLPEARRIGLGPGVYLPMMAEDGPVGALVLARPAGGGPFSVPEQAAAEVFASSAAIVLALAEARQQVMDGRIVNEHERIARDLHDTVIQRLFAIGIKLQAAERMAPEPIGERIRETVDTIDEVIREIRETIFGLNRPSGDSGLRQAVRDLASEARDHLGFAPRIAFRGPVELVTDESLFPDVIAVLREALANVSRHAIASRVDVVISTDGANVSVTVADDGKGLVNAVSAGNGLANMRERAERRGGTFTATAGPTSGTVVSWEVPLQS